MKDRTKYQHNYYVSHKEELLVNRKGRYATDDDYKARCRLRDRERYHRHKDWGGLLLISTQLFS